MLRVFYLDVAKVDENVAYICMLQVYVSSILGVSYVCLTMFYLDVTYISNGFQMFSGVFASVFICRLLYITTVASRCLKNRSGVAHWMRVGSGWWCG
jgi:hypothetical protein